MTRQQQEEKFKEAYASLNPEQRLAVDTIEGPVMVIAGPGTGKTQILSARIGKILNDTDALPENILCLTYTDAGVVAMRKRLLQFIGADAYKVNIYTFHAFCNDVIQDNLSLFEKTALDAISELESIELFTDLINGFGKDNPLKRYRGDVYYEINNLRNLFSTMKKEGWTPFYIHECIDQYLEDIETRDEFIYKKAYKQFKAGEVKQNKVDEEHAKMAKLRAAVDEYEKYQEMMRKRNRYDFDDMINWVIKAFENQSFLLQNYQEKFLYLLVDEYQDTSGTQNKIVELLMSYWDVPNVFVVGDDDQSVYRFQGANVENMLAFAKRYESDLLKVVLTNNYRSTQPILNVSKTLIERNQERLVNQIDGLSKDLLAANSKYQGAVALPLLKEYNTQRDEMIDITLTVDGLLKQGLQPGKIGIIYKENKYGEELATYFKLKQIPVYSKRNQNLLTIPFAKKLILLLRYLEAEHDAPFGGEEMLFEILHFDWLHIPAIEIAKLTVEVSGRAWGANKTTLRELLIEKVTQPKKDLFAETIHPKLAAASTIIEQLISEVPNLTLQHLMAKMVQEGGILPYIMQHEEKILLLQVLNGLFDFIKEETRRNPFMTLKEIVRVLELMNNEGIALPIVQVSGNEKGINLLTAHGSKGLEFEYVFVVGVNASNWEKKRKPGGGYTLPDTMFESKKIEEEQDVVRRRLTEKEIEEEELRRLFYVALTRAEKQLTISYSKFKIDGKQLEPSMFIAEIQEEHPLEAETVTLDEETVFAFNALAFDKILAPEIEQPEADFVSRLLEKFAMNVTALSNYLSCPLKFYYTNLIRIPSSKNEATEFGNAVHFALEQLFKKMQDNNDIFPEKEVFLNDFSWYMHRHREFFTKEQYDRRIEYGYEVLTNYYDKYINTFHKVVSVERMIRNVLVKGIPLKGKLDKLEFYGKDVLVVDYKSGDIDKAKPKLLPPNDKEPNGGDYWRQAVFYKLLIDNYDQKDWTVTSVVFDFVEPDKKKGYQTAKVVVEPEDVTTVTAQIVNVWDKIQQRDFYTGCGKPDCHWCNFVKENNMAIALHELTEEREEEN